MSKVALFLAVAASVLALTVACRSGARRAPAAGVRPPTPVEAPQRPGGAVRSSSGCGKAHEAGAAAGTLVSGGLRRSYRLYVPRAYDPNQPAPLVLDFHGFGATAREQEAYSGLEAKAQAAGFITVAPDGTGQPQRWYLAGERIPGLVDDFAFVRQLIDELGATVCLDPARTYATGISNGGGFASLLACKLNDKIAAIAPVAGEPFSALNCEGKDPIPIVAFHGTADPLVPFEGGLGAELGLAGKGTREEMKEWARFNGCDLTLRSERVAADVMRESYSGCRNGADVQLYVVEGGGHTWPGAIDVPVLGKTTHSIQATDILWRFFAAHPKP